MSAKTWNFDTKVANIAVRLPSVKQSAICASQQRFAIALSPDAKCMKRTYPVGNRILTALSLFNFLAELDRLLVDGVLQLYQQHEY
jgi:hypothetical protein